MSDDPSYYEPGKSKASYLHDPTLKYIHRFLAFTFSGRKDYAGVLTKTELFFLWCMKNNIKVNLGYWLVSQFATVMKTSKIKRPIILGSLITYLPVNEKLIDLEHNDLHVACKMSPLDLDCFVQNGSNREGSRCFLFYYSL